MDLSTLIHWLDATSGSIALRESILVYSIIETTRALTLCFATVLVLVLGLLGFGLTNQTVDQQVRKTHSCLPDAWIVIATGVPMFLSEAIKCYDGPPFGYTTGLVIASIYPFTIRQRVTSESTPRQARLTTFRRIPFY